MLLSVTVVGNGCLESSTCMLRDLVVSWLTRVRVAERRLGFGQRLPGRNEMRKLTASEMNKVAGGSNYEQLLAKANQRYFSLHPSGKGLVVATTPPN